MYAHSADGRPRPFLSIFHHNAKEMDILLPDELLVRVSMYLDLSAILTLRAASPCLFNLTPLMLEHDPATNAVMAIVISGKAESTDAIFSAPSNRDDACYIVQRVVHRLVCRPHLNRRVALPTIILDLVHHPVYGLDSKGFALLLRFVLRVSPPMALRLLGLIGLAGPGWVTGVIADNGSSQGYALEMYSAMLNFGDLEDSRLNAMVADIANECSELPVCYYWTLETIHSARTSRELPQTGYASSHVDAFFPDEGIARAHEKNIVPLAGLSWIMAHIRSIDPKTARFGAEMLTYVLDDGVPAICAVTHPGVAFGVIQALSLAAASQWGHVNTLWDIAARFIGDTFSYLNDMTSSDLLKNLVLGCSRPAPGNYLNGAAKIMIGLFRLLGGANMAPNLALDFSSAAIALRYYPIRDRLEIFAMVDQMVSYQNSTVASLLSEHWDIPSFYAEVISFPDASGQTRAAALQKLLHHPKRLTDQTASDTLAIQCGRALASVGAWDRISYIVPNAADTLLLPALFRDLVRMCFGAPLILVAMNWFQLDPFVIGSFIWASKCSPLLMKMWAPSWRTLCHGVSTLLAWRRCWRRWTRRPTCCYLSSQICGS
ncbi:hypothetical protein BC828DRAFT_416623 [Blastocladiella britannica]|nr:hypothetical protein BC828DRAFT_416623 [Blastocladiella britannica]